MNNKRFYWLEKFQVYLAVAAGLVGFYWLSGPLFRPPDPDSAIVFVSGGRWADLALLAGVIWALAAVFGLLLVTARLEGVVLAVVLAVGGICLRSPEIRTLFWRETDQPAGVYAGLVVELFLLLAILVVAVAIVVGIRSVFARMCGNSPAADSAGKGRQPRGGLWAMIQSDAPREKTEKTDPKSLKMLGGYLGLGTVIGVALLALLLRSPLRGQILFSLIAGMGVAFLVADQVFPTRYGLLAMIVPLLLGVLFYMLGVGIVSDGAHLAWAEVACYSRPLPIDWLAAGSGGAVLGYWISSRVHEARYLQAQEKKVQESL